MTWFAIAVLACVIAGLAVLCLSLSCGWEQHETLLEAHREGLCEAERRIEAIEARLAEMEEDL